ncbi:hypothetical protein, partial [Bacillus cereus]
RKAKRKKNTGKGEKVKERADMLQVEELRKAKRKRDASKGEKVKERAKMLQVEELRKAKRKLYKYLLQ